MTRPDLSLLFAAALAEDAHRSSAGALPQATAAPQAPATEERHGADRPQSAVATLIAELRASQAELESQNQMLRYSQAVAERASERFETLFASVPLALMVVDAHDIVVQANAMAHRSFQPSERDRPLTMLQPFMYPNDLARVQEGFAQANALGHSEIKEVVFTIEGHPSITGDLHIARIEAAQEDAPAPVQFLCAVIDQGPLLAERRALQDRNAQLHASEKRLAAVIDSALDAILCVDQQQRITVFNPTAAALFQCNADDALGSPLERFLPGAAQALAFSQLTTQAMLGEMTARTAGGKELAVEVSISFERHATGETATVFARDLTGRKKAEAQRNELEAQLRESHKMQAVGTMAGGIAHDFNNILGAILGNVELAKADCAAAAPAMPGSALLESLEEIDKAARRARDLVRQILTFSRNEPPQRAAVQLAEVAHETERLLRVTLPPSIALHVQVPEQLPPRARRRHAGWTGPAQSLHQCRAGAGQPPRPCSRRGATRTARAAPARTPGPRRPHRLHRIDGARRWPGHGRGHAGANLRAFFHHQARGPGYGPGARRGARHHAHAWRGRRCAKQPGQGQPLHAVFPDRRQCSLLDGADCAARWRDRDRTAALPFYDCAACTSVRAQGQRSSAPAPRVVC